MSAVTPSASSGLTPRAVLMLVLPPLLWAGNAVVGRAVAGLIPPVTFNLVRWTLAALILLPMAWQVLRPSSPLWAHWKRYAIIGLLGIGCYNMFQYMALKTSTPVNVTLVASSMPLWMMLIGRLFYDAPVTRHKLGGAVLSLAAVLFVLSRGEWANLLQLRLVIGDLYMVAATIAWSAYSWMLLHTREPASVRANWQAFVLAQVVFGLAWSGLFTGVEWAVQPDLHVEWNALLIGSLAYVAIGPAVLAYAFWSRGVQLVGPTVAGFFVNLTPLFAALLSAMFLGDMPSWYHAVAFGLIVAGIVVSSRQRD